MATPIRKGIKTDFLNKASGDFMKMYLATSGVYASFAEGNPYGQFLIVGADGNEDGSAGSSLDMGLKDAAGYGIAHVGIYGDDDGDDMSAGWIRLVESRISLTVSQTGNQTIMALRGCIALDDDVLPNPASFTSAVEGQVDLKGDHAMVYDSTDVVGLSAGRFILSLAGDMTIRRSYIVAGVRSELSVASSKTVTQTAADPQQKEGAFAAFAATGKTGTAGDNWDDGLYLDRVNNALGFRSVAAGYPCGIAEESTTPSANKTHVIRVNVAGTPGYIPVFLNATCA